MKKYVFILIPSVVLFTSCIYTAMYHFSNSDLEWLSPYEQGDTVLFSSSEGMDTMTVEMIKVRDDYLPFMANEGISEMHATGRITCHIHHRGNLLENDIAILKNAHDVLRVCFSFEHRGVIFNTKNEPRLYKVKVNGATYENAIKIDDSNSEIIFISPNNCEYFIWSKSKGLLQYKYLNGDVYTFYKKIPRKK